MYLISVIYSFITLLAVYRVNRYVGWYEGWFLRPYSRGHYILWGVFNFIPYVNVAFSILIALVSLTSKKKVSDWLREKL
jgi:hypothetical protein